MAIFEILICFQIFCLRKTLLTLSLMSGHVPIAVALSMKISTDRGFCSACMVSWFDDSQQYSTRYDSLQVEKRIRCVRSTWWTWTSKQSSSVRACTRSRELVIPAHSSAWKRVLHFSYALKNIFKKFKNSEIFYEFFITNCSMNLEKSH